MIKEIENLIEKYNKLKEAEEDILSIQHLAQSIVNDTDEKEISFSVQSPLQPAKEVPQNNFITFTSYEELFTYATEFVDNVDKSVKTYKISSKELLKCLEYIIKNRIKEKKNLLNQLKTK